MRTAWPERIKRVIVGAGCNWKAMERVDPKDVELWRLGRTKMEWRMTKIIVIAQDFAAMPGGRTLQDGPFSGELFRRSILEPALRECGNIVIDLDGCGDMARHFLKKRLAAWCEPGSKKGSSAIG